MSYFQWNMIKRRLLARYTVQNPSDSPLFLLVFKCVIPIYLVLLTFLYSFKNNDLVFIETLLFCVCSYLIGLHEYCITCQALFYVGDVLVNKVLALMDLEKTDSND